MIEACWNCDWWDSGFCTNYDSGMFAVDEYDICPLWENYEMEMWGDG